MAVAYQTASVGYSAPAAGTYTAPLPSGTVGGDYLVAVQFCDPDTSVTFLTPTGGSTWVSAGAQQTLAFAYSARAWGKFAGGSEPGTYAFTAASGSDSAVIVMRFTGVDPISPIDVAPSWAGSSSASVTHTANSVTPPATGDHIICAYFALNRDTGVGASYTAVASPLTERIENPTTLGYIHIMTATAVAAAGGVASGTKAATFAASKPWGAMSMVIGARADTVPSYVSAYTSYY